MKRKIAIRATMGVMVCCLLLGGCVEEVEDSEYEYESESETETETELGGLDSDSEVETESETERESESESEHEPESELESESESESEESCFGLSEAEVGCVVKCLNRQNILCHGVRDFDDVSCLGYWETVDGSGGTVVNYDIVVYGVALKNHRWVGIVCVPTEELRECGINREDEWLRICESRRG